MTTPASQRAAAAQPLRALIVRQPYAWAIGHGTKRVENRGRTQRTSTARPRPRRAGPTTAGSSPSTPPRWCTRLGRPTPVSSRYRTDPTPGSTVPWSPSPTSSTATPTPAAAGPGATASPPTSWAPGLRSPCTTQCSATSCPCAARSPRAARSACAPLPGDVADAVLTQPVDLHLSRCADVLLNATTATTAPRCDGGRPEAARA